jgi:hypothetical protein
MMKHEELQEFHRLAMDNAELSLMALRQGNFEKFRQLSSQAFIYEKKAALGLYDQQIEPSRSVLFRSAAYIALDNADFIEAQKLYEFALEGDVPNEIEEELKELKFEIDRIKTQNETFIQHVIIQLKSKTKVSKELIESEIERIIKIFEPKEINTISASQYLERQFAIDSEKHTTIETEDYETWIYEKKGTIEKRYWDRYKQLLLTDKEWAPDTIDKLDNITDDILDHLKNPKDDGDWDKRGLVVGHVQSGKTSNYIGLMCKAADYGYKIIVVLAGLSKDLRSQTQFRIDEGFLGWDTKIDRSLQEQAKRFGVSKYDNRPQAHYLTSSALDGDFGTAKTYGSGTNIKGTDPVVVVVKKNGSVLKELIKYLANQGELIEDEKRIIKKIPILVIDDEADNASININPEGISTINGLIRSLLSIFQRSAYVGYTATPFANVFIPLAKSEDALSLGLNITKASFWKDSGEDLFPRDFIINIPPPSNYMGPKEVFGIDSEVSVDQEKAILGLPIVNKINSDECQKYFPLNHKMPDDPPSSIPESLKEAIKSFILSCAIRRARGDFKEHNSMLVHVTQFVRWQNKIASLIDRQLKSYQQQIQYKQGKLLSELKHLYESKFIPVTNKFIEDKRFENDRIKIYDWLEIERQLNKSASKIQVRAIHGESTSENLDFPNISALDYYDHKNGLSVIAIGGNKLSRGLTLNGLSMSYYIRPSKMYDTLMQMGRWFGYHPTYIDLCRLYTTDNLIKWYKYITVASEELREEFDEMKKLRKTPRQFGIKVRQHPDVLLITASNKMGSGELMELTFSDKLRETWCFKRDKLLIQNNYLHSVNFINSLGKPQPKNGQPFVWYSKNNFELLTQFLGAYVADNTLEHFKIIDYITEQAKASFLINWTIVLISNERDKKNNFFKINNKFVGVGLTMRSDDRKGEGENYEISRSHIIDPKHEFIDFDTNGELYKTALQQTIEDWSISQRKNKKPEPPAIPTGKNIRAKRPVTDGLLLIYPLDPNPEGWKESTISNPIIGYALSFPKNESDRKITYKVNETFMDDYAYEEPEEIDIE